MVKLPDYQPSEKSVEMRVCKLCARLISFGMEWTIFHNMVSGTRSQLVSGGTGGTGLLSHPAGQGQPPCPTVARPNPSM